MIALGYFLGVATALLSVWSAWEWARGDRRLAIALAICLVTGAYFASRIIRGLS